MKSRMIFGPGKITIGNSQLICGIIDNHTPVFTLESSQKILGFDGKSTSWLYDFTLHLSRFLPVSVDVLDEVQEPSIAIDGAAEYTVIDAAVFLQICAHIVSANTDGYLYASELKFARNAKALLDHFEAHPPGEAVEHASGFNAYKIAAKSAISNILIDEGLNHGRWIPAFPEEFFSGIMQIKGWKWDTIKDHINEMAMICSDVVFERINPETLAALQSAKPRMRYRKAGKPQQYLLHEQLIQQFKIILELMMTSNYNEAMFRLLLEKVMPVLTPEIAVKPNATTANTKLALFGENISKAAASKKFR